MDIDLLKQCEEKLKERFEILDEIAFYNEKKVLNAFKKCEVSAQDFAGTTGYASSDRGREKLSQLFATIFKAENAIVSPLITCGTHALSIALFGLLRPKDTVLSITGKLYDTLEKTLFGKGNGSLQDYDIKFEKVDLKNGEIDLDNVLKYVKKLKPKVVYLQKSRGYSSRTAISTSVMKEVFDKIRQVNKNCFIFVDNCYGEFTEKQEPIEVGADVAVGSLIKNAGGGIVPTGGYIVGSNKAIDLISSRFTCPSLKLESGSYEMGYRLYFQGIFLSPHVVKEALKGAYLIGELMSMKGYEIKPKSDENSYDIVKSIMFNTEDELIKFVQKIQEFSPIDSNALPMPWEMPGYQDKVIMAAGTFVDGASIELSCDSPIRKPYIAYFQGGLTYEHVKAVAENLIDF